MHLQRFHLACEWNLSIGVTSCPLMFVQGQACQIIKRKIVVKIRMSSVSDLFRIKERKKRKKEEMRKERVFVGVCISLDTLFFFQFKEVLVSNYHMHPAL